MDFNNNERKKETLNQIKFGKNKPCPLAYMGIWFIESSEKALTFFCLSICNLQIKLLRFAQFLLLDNLLFQITHRNVQSIKTDCIIFQWSFEFIVHRHCALQPNTGFIILNWFYWSEFFRSMHFTHSQFPIRNYARGVRVCCVFKMGDFIKCFSFFLMFH